MKVKQEFTPVSIVFEAQEEFNFFWNLIEETYKKYEVGSKERKFLIDLSNAISDRWADESPD